MGGLAFDCLNSLIRHNLFIMDGLCFILYIDKTDLREIYTVNLYCIKQKN